MSDETLRRAIDAHQQGQLSEAEGLYAQVLEARPDHADALALLGLLKQAQGNLDEAKKKIARAVELDPKAALFRIYQGNILLASGDPEQAVVAYRVAANLEPGKPEPYFGLGNAYMVAGAWDQAEQAFVKTLSIAPKHYEARNSLALIYNHQGKQKEAFEELKQVTTDAPTYGDGWLNLCNLAEKLGEFEISRDAGMIATQLMPDNFSAWFGLGVALNRLLRDEEALAVYHKALELKPERADIWDNLAQTYQYLNRIDEAHKAYLATIEAADQVIKDEDGRRVDEKEYGNRHWHLALIELLRGDLKRGFARYRSRFVDVGALKRPPYAQPLWQGEDLSGKTLLVTDEQGMGDCMMMARYIPILKKQTGARILFRVHPALKALFASWDVVDGLYTKGDDITGFDYHTSIFDLPYQMGTTLETIPSDVPYLPILEPDDETRLAPTDKLKVGLIWGGSPLHKHDARRSVPLKVLSRLFDMKGVQFYNMNRDKKEGDDAILAAYPDIIDVTPRLRNFGDSARIVQQLDLSITCDTANAHLSGGMAKPIWTMLPFSPDWRWLMDREDTAWYPTMRLFRQPRPKDWESVINNIRVELEKLLGR